MAEALYACYLAVLLLLPPLVRWRWGLLASLLVGVVELGLVLLVLQQLSVHQLLPARPPVYPLPKEQVLEHLMKAHREGFARDLIVLMVWIMIPGIAVLAGAGLALMWSAVQAIRRSLARRRSV